MVQFFVLCVTCQRSSLSDLKKCSFYFTPWICEAFNQIRTDNSLATRSVISEISFPYLSIAGGFVD